MPIVKLVDVRSRFGAFFEPKAVQGEGDPRFSGAFVIVPGSDNAKALDAAMKQAAKDKWGAKADSILADLIQRGRTAYKERPLTDKNGEVYDGFEGMHSLSASNEVRPAIIDKDTRPLTPADGRPYDGCYVDVSVEIWAQDNAWGRRINSKLRWVQYRREGDAFTGGKPVSQDEFESIADGAAAGDLV